MKQINIVFPHQLFEESPLFDNKEPFYLVEEYLFFKHYPFHKQKIAFHRTSMKRYAAFLSKEKTIEVVYIEATERICDIRLLIPELKRRGVEHINYIEPSDNWLNKRITAGCLKNEISNFNKRIEEMDSGIESNINKEDKKPPHY